MFFPVSTRKGGRLVVQAWLQGLAWAEWTRAADLAARNDRLSDLVKVDPCCAGPCMRRKFCRGACHGGDCALKISLNDCMRCMAGSAQPALLLL